MAGILKCNTVAPRGFVHRLTRNGQRSRRQRDLSKFQSSSAKMGLARTGDDAAVAGRRMSAAAPGGRLHCWRGAPVGPAASQSAELYKKRHSPCRTRAVTKRMASSEPASCPLSNGGRAPERGGMASSSPVHATLTVTASDGVGDSPPTTPPGAHRQIRRSLSPLLDFSRAGLYGNERRNFCTIGECAFCKPLTDNHRLSPLRSPVISPSSNTLLFLLTVPVYQVNSRVESALSESLILPYLTFYFKLTFWENVLRRSIDSRRSERSFN